MQDLCQNIYKSARISAGINFLPACRELAVSETSLKNYEDKLCRFTVPDDVVDSMCILYENKFLAIQHLQRGILGKYLPAIAEENIKGATLTMISSFNDVSDLLKAIIRIVSDGKISDSEDIEWQKCKQEMVELIGALMSVVLASGETEKRL